MNEERYDFEILKVPEREKKIKVKRKEERFSDHNVVRRSTVSVRYVFAEVHVSYAGIFKIVMKFHSYTLMDESSINASRYPEKWMTKNLQRHIYE